MLVLPQVKKSIGAEGDFIVGSELHYTADNEEETFCGVRLLQECLARRDIIVKRGGAAALSFQKIVHNNTEYYELDVAARHITVRYTSPLAARNAAATLHNLFVLQNKQYRVRCVKIRDWADSRYRGYMMDVARRYVEMREIRLRIRQIALAKFNVLHLHLLDTERYALFSEALPELNRDPIFRQYTLGQMRELVLYAKSFGITILPDLDLPGHGLYFLERFPELKCRVNGVPSGIWDACVSNEKTYEVLDCMLGELVTVFDSEYIHLGGDELSFYDMENSGYWPSWHECDGCRALSKNEGYRDTSDLYCHFVRRAYALVRKRGRKLMIFNDAIDISRSPDLPRDILIHFWRVAAETRGPHEGCSMERFLEEGFHVVNSFYEEAYIDDYVTEQRLCDWHPALRPHIEEKYRDMVVGGEVCAWGIRNHFVYTLPSAFLLFGDRFWNEQPLPADEETHRALTRQVISPEEDFPNVFHLLGGGLMPLYGENKFWLVENLTAAEIDEAIEKVTRALAGGRCESSVLKAYIVCLEDARKKYAAGETEIKKVPIG